MILHCAALGAAGRRNCLSARRRGIGVRQSAGRRERPAPRAALPGAASCVADEAQAGGGASGRGRTRAWRPELSLPAQRTDTSVHGRTRGGELR